MILFIRWLKNLIKKPWLSFPREAEKYSWKEIPASFHQSVAYVWENKDHWYCIYSLCISQRLVLYYLKNCRYKLLYINHFCEIYINLYLQIERKWKLFYLPWTADWWKLYFYVLFLVSLGKLNHYKTFCLNNISIVG